MDPVQSVMQDVPRTPDVQMPELWVNVLLFAPPVLGLLYSVAQWSGVSKVMNGSGGSSEPLMEESKRAKMMKISGLITKGAISFLKTEYSVMVLYIVLFSIGLVVFTGLAQDWTVGAATAVSFVVGGFTSMLCGWIGMAIAVKTNVVTTYQSWNSLSKGFDVALQGGCVMGLSLVSLGVLGLLALIFAFQKWFGDEQGAEIMYECIAGYGLGGSSVALFGRVGGGIYTKAADVGADLAGKNKWGLPEDHYLNPGCIADNVGDNVGDIAGMGADLFGSFAESTCAALVLAAASPALKANHASIMFPVLVSSSGVVVGLLTLLLRACVYKVTDEDNSSVERALKGVLVISTVLMTPTVLFLAWACLPAEFRMDASHPQVLWWHCAVPILLGLWSGLIIGYITEYYTSSTYSPVRKIANSQIQSAATGVILGLALGYLSCIVPTICLGLTVLVAHTLVGMFGVALSALGMLGTLTMCLTIDAYGPISDNAGGIAEMSELEDYVRERTDCLDAAGNTTAAIGKGFAIGSAALVSLALFGAYTVRANVQEVDILNEWVFTGLLFGAMMPYAFAAWTMQSVGEAADDMVKECNRQFDIMFKSRDVKEVLKDPDAFPDIEVDYDICIDISTKASLREMIAPGALVILSPLVAGLGFGKNACAGMLSGALVSSVQLAISMSNSGGAWDNSKKFISAGGLGDGMRKGSDAHSNSVTGDTVGDPLKDTSGPALNIVMKLTAILSLVFGSAIARYSNEAGGPFWL